MPSRIALRSTGTETRERLYQEAAALCARFGIDRSPERPPVPFADVEAMAMADREVLRDLVRVVAALADGQRAGRGTTKTP